MSDRDLPGRVDVLVVGAGSAGASAAWQCARQGLSTLVLDRRPLDAAGAQWSNGVPGWAYDAAGLARPGPDEASPTPTMHLVPGWGPTSLKVDGIGIWEVRMPVLQDRLRSVAADAGAQVVGGVTVHGVDGDLDATDGVVRVETSAGTVRARWLVDASGLHGAPWLGTRRIATSDLCVAAQQEHVLRDRHAAAAFFARVGAKEGEVVSFTGVEGGYSVVNVRFHGDTMAILTGTMAGAGLASGPVLLERFVADHADWIGERLHGGSRAIPVATPGRMARGRVAWFGDAASQVFAAHGSGIAQQLAGAPILADALASGAGPAAYARRWWTTFGADAGASWAMHRASRHLKPAWMVGLVRAGIVRPERVRAMLEQRPIRGLPLG